MMMVEGKKKGAKRRETKAKCMYGIHTDATFCNVYVYLCASFLCVEMKKCTQRSIYEGGREREGVIMMVEEMKIDVCVCVCVCEEMNESSKEITRESVRKIHH